MPTTSLKIPDELKSRAAEIARLRGITTHAFLLETVRTGTEQAERRAEFVNYALSARKDAVDHNRGIPAEDVHNHIRKVVKRQPTQRPAAGSWRE